MSGASKAYATAAALLLGAIGVGAALLGAAGSSEVDNRDTRWSRIQHMSAEEKARLKRNLEEFQQMPDEQRAELQRLHEALAEDQRETGGRSFAVMERYHTWIQELSPWQREELRETTEPAQRVQKVREFLEQSERTRDRRFSRDDRPMLDPESFARIMQLVEERLQVDSHERSELESLPPVVRNFRVLRHALDFGGRGGPSWRDARVSAAAMREWERSAPGGRPPGPPDERTERRVAFGLLQGLLFQIEHEVEERKPDKAALEAHFLGLERSQQDEIMQLPSDDQERMLVLLYLSSQDDAFGRALAEIRPMLERGIRRRSGDFGQEPQRGGGRGRDADRRRPPGPPGGPPPDRRGGPPRGPRDDGPPPEGRDEGPPPPPP